MPSTSAPRNHPDAACSVAPYWIVMGDLHDSTARFDAIPGLAEAEGVIVTGDLTVTGGVAAARRVLDALSARNPRILAQIGNMDRGEITDWLESEDRNIHARVRLLAPDTACRRA